jgi:hypothetical protein
VIEKYGLSLPDYPVPSAADWEMLAFSISRRDFDFRMMRRLLALSATLLCLCSCAGIERVNASRQSDSQLILRHSQLTRELSATRAGGSAERDVTLMETERDAIERELLSRCEAGDKAACPDYVKVSR